MRLSQQSPCVAGLSPGFHPPHTHTLDKVGGVEDQKSKVTLLYLMSYMRPHLNTKTMTTNNLF